MSYLTIARELFSQNPELFSPTVGLTLAEQQKLISDRIAFLKTVPEIKYQELAHTLFGNTRLSFDVIKGYLSQSWAEKNVFSNVPDDKTKTDMRASSLRNKDKLEELAKFTTSFVFGSENIEDFVGCPSGYHLGHLKFPQNEKRTENVAAYLSPEQLSDLTTNPLIPVAKQSGYLILMGKHAKTNDPLLFTLHLPDPKKMGDLYKDSEMPLCLYINGCEPKQIARLSYKPTGSAHEQYVVNDKGQLVVNDQGIAVSQSITTNNVHLHGYVGGYSDTSIFNPRSYTARLTANDYLPTPSCQSAIVDLMDRYNIMHPTVEKGVDIHPIDEQLTSGVLSCTGAVCADPDTLKYLPVTTETYDMLRTLQEEYVKQGQVNTELVDKIDNLACQAIGVVDDTAFATPTDDISMLFS